MPTLHNPLGWVMDLAGRQRLVEIARRHGLLIIEDASYAYLAEDPPPPLATLAPEATVYVSGLSKSVATGLRMGFVSVAESQVPVIERAIRATTWNTPGIITAIACRWLDDGTVHQLEVAKRDDARMRQSVAREVVGDLPCIAHPTSYFVWLPLPEDARADRIAATLARQHISVSTGEPYATSIHVPQAIRLALGSTDLTTLREALGTVRDAVSADPYG
jgi:DNA-binding transcriptional MocR family regulator